MSLDDTTAQTCAQCGSPVPPDARFCPNCGLKMGLGAMDDEVVEDVGVEETTVMPPVRETYREESVTPAPVAVMPEERPWPWGWILAILGGILALLLIALLVQELGEGGDDTPDDTTTSVAPQTSTVSTETTRRTATTSPPATDAPDPDPDPAPTDPPATTSPPATDPPVTDPPVTVAP